MKIILIAALNKLRVIGRDGKIPWHLSEDLQRFKDLTTSHVVLMGRKTFESIGTPLPNRRNIVISRRTIHSAHVETFPTVEAAFETLKDVEKVFIIGGGEIFRQTIDRADELMLTIVDNEDQGDTCFPPYEHLIGNQFILSSEEKMDGYQFRNYIKSRN